MDGQQKIAKSRALSKEDRAALECARVEMASLVRIPLPCTAETRLNDALTAACVIVTERTLAGECFGDTLPSLSSMLDMENSREGDSLPLSQVSKNHLIWRYCKPQAIFCNMSLPLVEALKSRIFKGDDDSSIAIAQALLARAKAEEKRAEDVARGHYDYSRISREEDALLRCVAHAALEQKLPRSGFIVNPHLSDKQLKLSHRLYNRTK